MKMSINNLQSIILGREKDGGVKTIEIDCSEWKEKFPQLTKYRIEVTSPNGIIYCPEVTMNEYILTWPITKSDTALTGKGAYQIVATGENDERLTSAHLSLNIYSIMPGTAQETPPEYIESWVQNIVDTAERAELAAKKAEDAAAGIVITPEEIQSAVDSYLIKNPIKVEETDPTVPDWAKAEKKPTYTAEEIGAQPKGNYALKSEIPSVPVQSVNGKTGTIVLNASDVGAQPKGDYALKSDIPEILVKSVNGKTGDVMLTAQNVGALPADTEIVDQTARDGVATLSEEIDLIKGENEGEVITKNGVVVELYLPSIVKLTANANAAGAVNLYHCGKNMLPAYKGADTTSSGCTITKNSDGTVTISGTPASTVYFNVATTGAPIYLPAGDYTLLPYGFPEASSRITYALESLDGTVKRNVTVKDGVNSFTLEQGNTFKCNYTVRNTFTGEPITLGVMLVNERVLTHEYEAPVFEKIDTVLPVTLTSYKGTNILYTDSGDVLTVRTGSGKKKNTFDPAAYGLPVLRLWGDTSTMTKDDAVDLEYEYGDLTGTASVKWQGSSSLNYDKKNYTVKFDTAFEAYEGWGMQKKYCMKANYIDFSHSRNLCGAKLWGQIVASRDVANDALAACPNYGAVDGFPIVIMINDEYMGVYCFNIPKDGWMLNMGSGANEAILCADKNSDANYFKAEAVVGGDKTDFELEYTTDEDNAGWVQTSLNNLIRACINSNGSDLDTTIAAMLDWDSAIDYFIFSALIDNRDGISKNYLLHTWDGTKWYFDAYDMDSIFGLNWDGKKFLTTTAGCTIGFLRGRHRVCELICTYKLDAFKARYAALRAGALSEDNVAMLFRNFAGQISRPLLDEDNRLWPMIPLTNTNNVQQAIDWYRLRVMKIDAEVEAMK